MAAIAALLSQIPLLSNLGPDQLSAVERICERCLFTAGQTVVREGEEADAAYFLIDGPIECITRSPTDETISTPIPSGATLLELALIVEIDVTATCIARGSAKVLRIPRKAMLCLMEEDAELTNDIIATLTARLHEMSETMREVSSVFEDARLSA